jgi:hypothetical protein
MKRADETQGGPWAGGDLERDGPTGPLGTDDDRIALRVETRWADVDESDSAWIALTQTEIAPDRYERDYLPSKTAQASSSTATGIRKVLLGPSTRAFRHNGEEL